MARNSSLLTLYICLGYLAVPLLVAVTLWRGCRDRLLWRTLPERFGCLPACPPDGLWVHAVSVGEVQAAAVLVRRLHADFPDRPLLVTCGTVTGRARAEALFDGVAMVRFLPWDLPPFVGRFLRRVQPRVGIILETELWPNLYRAAARQGVPLVVVSARLSAKSVRRYRRLPTLVRGLLRGVHVCAQSAEDAERFIAVGADPARVSVCGNIKFDFEPPADTAARGARLRGDLGAGRPLWVAGSTHEGEEEQLLDAHAVLRAQLPRALLVLAPRHPPRFAAVAALLARRGIAHATRTSGAPVDGEVAVLLLDTLGELLAFYAAADVAFVGGSLVPVGGHNLLEPAALGRPVLCGPFMANSAGVAPALAASGALTVVAGAEELAAALQSLLQDATARERGGAASREVVAVNRGALGRITGAIRPLAERPAG